MDCPQFFLDNGTKIRTIDKLEPETGMLISPKNLANRKPSTDGEICGIVGGHGGDVYWVQHEGDDVPAAYSYSEFNLSLARRERKEDPPW